MAEMCHHRKVYYFYTLWKSQFSKISWSNLSVSGNENERRHTSDSQVIIESTLEEYGWFT